MERRSLKKLGVRLAKARELADFTQEEVASLLGMNRVVLSYAENGQRPINTILLQRLSELYRRPVSELLGEKEMKAADLEEVLYRSLEGELAPEARAGLSDFLNFLDSYADLLEDMGRKLRGRVATIYHLVLKGYPVSRDIRRKAEEVRDGLGLRLAPIANLHALLEAEGVVVYRAPLGEDLSKSISGAFLNHDRLGFSILVNSDTTPGRQTFTMAHEYAHALFHSLDSIGILCRSGDRRPEESFADRFAGEFLVPSEALRRLMEHLNVRKKIRDPRLVVRFQRYFRVSYQAMLVRLRQEGYLSEGDYEELKGISPLSVALSLGYRLTQEEYDPGLVGPLYRFPVRFLEDVREANQIGVITEGMAAELLCVSFDEVLDVLNPETATASEDEEKEAREYRGVASGG